LRILMTSASRHTGIDRFGAAAGANAGYF